MEYVIDGDDVRGSIVGFLRHRAKQQVDMAFLTGSKKRKDQYQAAANALHEVATDLETAHIENFGRNPKSPSA